GVGHAGLNRRQAEGRPQYQGRSAGWVPGACVAAAVPGRQLGGGVQALPPRAAVLRALRPPAQLLLLQAHAPGGPVAGVPSAARCGGGSGGARRRGRGSGGDYGHGSRSGRGGGARRRNGQQHLLGRGGRVTTDVSSGGKQLTDWLTDFK
ncbi:unnamed protein product, partial [Phaeothamnion confervicola]